MKKRAEEIHNELVKELEEKVRKNYFITMTGVEVRSPLTGNLVGEIDLVGIVDNQWDLYEVKVNDSFEKSRRQLKNLKRYLGDCGKIRLYYYSGKDGKIIEI
ncbi:hypothetical protein KY339_03270 [Candidatus Woesearchaeota archaeon]|nr:hypothetical protein [Candidatus Woesearchaeota archaeon]